MKICLFSNDYLPNIGGIANHVDQLGQALKNLGHEITILTQYECYLNSKFSISKIEEKNGIRVIRVPVLNMYLVKQLNRLIGYKCHLETIKNQFDIIHSHCLFDSYITKFIDFDNLIFTNHTSGFLKLFEDNKIKKIKKNISHNNKIIAPSKELAQKTSLSGFPSKDIHYIPNGVNIYKFNPNKNVDHLRKKLGLNDEKVVICARRFAEKNGVIYLVKAIPKVINDLNDDIKFVFVGESTSATKKSTKLEILNYIKKKNLREHVIFTGEIPYRKMPKYYCLGDVSVLPSLKEATSLTGLESMASGLPLIGTNVGGIPQIVNHRANGLLVPPKDSQALADAIIEILKEDDLRRKYGKKARKFVKENYTWEKTAKKTISVYKKCLK